MGDSSLHLKLEAALEAFPRARVAFKEWLGAQPIGGEDCDELNVVLSELIANAREATVRHEPITVWADLQGDQVWLEVTNEADRSVRFPPLPPPPSDPLEPAGRGLVIVDAFTDRLAAETIEGRTRVTVVKTLRPSR